MEKKTTDVGVQKILKWQSQVFDLTQVKQCARSVLLTFAVM